MIQLTEVVIIQILTIVLIIIAAYLILKIISIPKYNNLKVWSIPIFILLLNGLIFRVVYLIDKFSGNKIDINLYNLWSAIVHAQDKVTIIIYAIAVLAMTKINDKNELNRIFSWTPLDKEKDQK